jgi:hypothetical protein
MRGYITISDEEKNSILQSHSSFYNGYSVGNVPSGPQPLLQDEGPTDTNGINVNNRGEVKTYSNHLVNESIEEEFDMDDFETELEFDSKVNSSDEDFDGDDTVEDWETDEYEGYDEEDEDDEDLSYSSDSYGMDIDKIISMFDGSVSIDDEDEGPVYSDSDMDIYEEKEETNENETCEQCGSEMVEGECMECGGMYEGAETCEQCGSEMLEGECMECGGMYEEVDEDLRESFFKEKDRISEMFDRFKKFN